MRVTGYDLCGVGMRAGVVVAALGVQAAQKFLRTTNAYVESPTNLPQLVFGMVISNLIYPSLWPADNDRCDRKAKYYLFNYSGRYC